MGIRVTAIFDIGKTNKKFFLFDQDFNVVHEAFRQFNPIEDEDGYPTEDLAALTQWIKQEFARAFSDPQWSIETLNFSTYGASLVHLNSQGEAITPLYNYTKPYPADLEDEFYRKYGPEAEFGLTTGTTRAGMLNSGLQLFWLKHHRPAQFHQIHTSLHLPQYLSYCFTGKLTSEFTSIGCHTGLWDYREQGYHHWVDAEGLAPLLPKPVPTETLYSVNYSGKMLQVGIGMHDSSAALWPYVKAIPEPFALLSTGTWSVAMNPFSTGLLQAEDQNYDCIHYMQPNGKAVKAGRLFLGNEFGLQIQYLSQKYGRPVPYFQNLPFDLECYNQIRHLDENRFHWESLTFQSPPVTLWDFKSPEEAYHRLNYELGVIQVENLIHVLGDTQVKSVFLDGGFTSNPVFVAILRTLLFPLPLHLSDASQGTALGAALASTHESLDSTFLERHYRLKSTL